MKYAPSMIGWFEELDYGQPMDINSPEGLQVKFVITPEGVKVIALAEEAALAQEMLQKIGFLPEQVKKMLCG
jgi:hypothetical protein